MTTEPKKMEAPAEKLEWDAECQRHGHYRATGYELMGKRMGGVCPMCVSERQARDAETKEARRRAERSRRVSRLMGSCGIPPRFVGRSFDNYRAQEGAQARALKLCRSYASRFEDMLSLGACVVMVGNPGTGKTHLASAIAMQVMESGRAVHFTTVGRLLRHVKSTYSRGADQTEEQVLQSYLEPDLLVLDEVGVQRGTEAEKFILTEAVGLRYEHMKPMLVMGNCTEVELVDHLGDRLVSRLQEGGGPFIVFDWEDYRPQVHTDDDLPGREVPDVDWSDGEWHPPTG